MRARRPPGSFFAGVLAPSWPPLHGAVHGHGDRLGADPAAGLGLGVFLALGLGLALPFLAVALARLITRLPRPGPWMETLKKVLAFPVYATVAWLVWVLALQVGPAGLFAA